MRLHTISVTVLLATFAGAAQAQDLEPPRARQGYYAAVGVHGFVDQNWEDGKAKGAWVGRETSIRIGQMITRRFGLGLQLDFGAGSKKGEMASLFGLGLAAQLEIASDFALHGGIGLGIASLVDENDKKAERRGTAGSEYFLGASYDWVPNKSRLTGGWAIIPMFQV